MHQVCTSVCVYGNISTRSAQRELPRTPPFFRCAPLPPPTVDTIMKITHPLGRISSPVSSKRWGGGDNENGDLVEIFRRDGCIDASLGVYAEKPSSENRPRVCVALRGIRGLSVFISFGETSLGNYLQGFCYLACEEDGLCTINMYIYT